MASSSNPPCAACKFLRRKCQSECVFVPYFPPDNPQRFINVHRIFGASNVSKLLNELRPHQREDAVNSLAYEAEMRLRDPVNGCVGIISLLHQQLRQLQVDLQSAKFELTRIQNLGGIMTIPVTGYGHVAAGITTPVVSAVHVMNGANSGNPYYNQQQSYHQCVAQQLVRNNCDEANHHVMAMNIASFGTLSQLQQPSVTAVADLHTTRVHPS